MLNRVLLRRALAGVLDGNPKPAAVITTVPITADLAASFPGVRWVYYCVDDFAEWPGLDGDTLRRMELDLLRHVSSGDLRFGCAEAAAGCSLASRRIC